MPVPTKSLQNAISPPSPRNVKWLDCARQSRCRRVALAASQIPVRQPTLADALPMGWQPPDSRARSSRAVLDRKACAIIVAWKRGHRQKHHRPEAAPVINRTGKSSCRRRTRSASSNPSKEPGITMSVRTRRISFWLSKIRCQAASPVCAVKTLNPERNKTNSHVLQQKFFVVYDKDRRSWAYVIRKHNVVFILMSITLPMIVIMDIII